MAPTRWQSENTEAQSRQYVERFAELEKRGADLHGEARMLDALLARKSSVLDAGCGTARVGAIGLPPSTSIRCSSKPPERTPTSPSTRPI